VSLGEPAIEELRKALDANEQPENPYVFPAVYGDGALQDVRKPFAWVLKHAGLPHMRVHDLRHSFISMGANMGTNLNALKEVVGHTQITTTEGYTHIAENKKRETANQIAEMIAG
jgi:site-specific recombinase XerD